MIIQRIIAWILKRGSVQLRVSKGLFLALLLNLVFGVGFFLTEHSVQQELTLADSIWWAMVTMTTVGYGDFYPETFVGRYVISYSCFIVGIGLLGYLVGTVAEVMFERVSRKRRGLMKIRKTEHVIICNCPSTERVLHLVMELRANVRYSSKGFVLVTDVLDELPEEFKDQDLLFLKGNPTREDILLKANVTECDGVIVLAQDPESADSDAQTFAVGAIVEMISTERKREIKVVTELVSRHNRKMMKRARTDGIVSTDGLTDCLMVQEYLHPGLHVVFEQVLTNFEGSQFYIFDTRLSGFMISEIHMAMMKYPANLQMIGIYRDDQPVLNPPRHFTIGEDDRLIMLAENRGDFLSFEEQLVSKKVS